jgi:HAD superfamily hydrolase (TIGR01549 family)
VSRANFAAIVLDLFDTLVQWAPQRLPQMEIGGTRVHTTLPSLIPVLERGFGPGFDLDEFIECYGQVLKEIEAERRASGVEITCTRRFRRALGRLGITGRRADDLAEELTRVHMAGVRAATAAPPEHAAVVRRLSQRHRMGLLSNFDDAQTGRAILADTGVANCFEVVVISAEVEVRKPHPAIFRHVLDRLGLSARDVLFVGDNPGEDVAGALGVGIPVAWVARGKGDFPSEIGTPDFTIDTLAELPSLLGME